MKKLSKVTFVFASLLLANIAVAEDYDNGYYGNNQQNYNAQQPNGAYDQQYQIPPNYNGQYYPQETQGSVGYHGTNKTSQNTAEEPYYFYYY